MKNYNIMTSILVSSMTAILVMIFVHAYYRTPPIEYRSSPLPVNTSTIDADKITQLQEKVQVLNEEQKKLRKNDNLLRQKITLLENGIESPDILTDNQQQSTTAIDIDQEEQKIANAAEIIEDEFDTLVDQLYYENYDPQWDADMQVAFSEIEARLNDFNFGSTRMTYSECKSQSCLVEFTHAGTADPAFISGLLAAKSATKVVLKDIEDNGVAKILAVYLR